MARNYSDRFEAELGVRSCKCKKCFQEIEKGELRIRFLAPGVFKSTQFFHPNCMFDYFTKRMQIKIRSTADITGLNNLSYSHRNLINKLVNDFAKKEAMKHESKVATVKNTVQKKASKRKREESEDEEEEPKKKAKKETKAIRNKGSKISQKEPRKKQESVTSKTVKNQSPGTNKNSTTTKLSKKQSSLSKKTPKKQTSVSKKSSTKQQDSVSKKSPKKQASVSKKSPQKQASKKTAKVQESSQKKPGKVKGKAAVKVPAAAKPTAVAAAAAATPAPKPAAKSSGDKKKLSDEVKKQLKSQVGKDLSVADFYEFTVNDLKLALKANDRSTTGNKTELTKQIIDCMTHGVPPRCPQCGGGRLRVKYHGGAEEFKCPGYMEDDDFINCSFKSDSVDRIPWKNP